MLNNIFSRIVFFIINIAYTFKNFVSPGLSKGSNLFNVGNRVSWVMNKFPNRIASLTHPKLGKARHSVYIYTDTKKEFGTIIKECLPKPEPGQKFTGVTISVYENKVEYVVFWKPVKK